MGSDVGRLVDRKNETRNREEDVIIIHQLDQKVRKKNPERIIGPTEGKVLE